METSEEVQIRRNEGCKEPDCYVDGAWKDETQRLIFGPGQQNFKFKDRSRKNFLLFYNAFVARNSHWLTWIYINCGEKLKNERSQNVTGKRKTKLLVKEALLISDVLLEETGLNTQSYFQSEWIT